MLLLQEGEFIWSALHVDESKVGSSLGVWKKHRLWVNKDWDVLLGESDCDWCWLIGHKVLEVSSGHISIHEFEEAICVGFLSKSNGNWCWLVGDEVLQVTSGNVGVHKLEESIGIRLLGESNSNWCWLVSDEVLEVASGDVGVHELE